MHGATLMNFPGHIEYTALLNAMEEIEVPCTDDNRFIMDDSEATILLELCIECPVYFECQKYALTARPEGGVWAGLRFGPGSKRKPKENT